MSRTVKFTAALAAATLLGAGAAAADIVTYERVYTTSPGQAYYTAPVQTYVTWTPAFIVRGEPQAVAVPDTVVTEQRYVVRRSTAYSGPETTVITEQPVITERYVVPQERVVIRPPNCGTYHYWNGATCVDARDEQAVFVRD